MKDVKLWLLKNIIEIKDLATFLIIVLMGVFIKFFNLKKQGVILTLKWLIAEGLMSLFVAFTVWAVFDQFFQFKKMFVYVICAWSGSLSTVFHKRIEMLINTAFDVVANYLKTLFTKK